MKDYNASDLIWLDKEKIVEIIQSTFESTIVEKDQNQTVIKVKWCVLDKENELNILKYGKDFINSFYNIYFYVYTPLKEEDQFVIVRNNKNNVDLKKFAEESILKNSNISSYRLTDNNSLIVDRKDICRIFWSMDLIPKGKDHVIKNGELITFQNMLCDIDVDFANMMYLSDLLIGTHLELFGEKYKIKKEV